MVVAKCRLEGSITNGNESSMKKRNKKFASIKEDVQQSLTAITAASQALAAIDLAAATTLTSTATRHTSVLLIHLFMHS